MFHIFESLFLLALDDEQGQIIESVAGDLEAILSGAVLAELILLNQIELEEGKIIVIDPMPKENPVLDKVLFEILDTAKPRKLKYWLNTLISQNIQDEIGHYLIEKNILTRKKKKLHLVIPYVENTSWAVSAQYASKNHLREIVLAGKQAEAADKVLLAFLYYGKLLKLAFTTGEFRTAHKRLKKLIIGEEGSTLGETMDDLVALTCEMMIKK